jgi:hypothetical protein
MNDKALNHAWIVGVELEAGKPPYWYAIGADSPADAVSTIVKLIGANVAIAATAPAPEGVVQPGEIVPLVKRMWP